MRPLSAAVLILAASCCVFGQVYTSVTIAGLYGKPAYAGDNNLGTLAQLNYPWSVAVDASHNVYIADTYNNVIRKVAASNGVITTFAGNNSQGFGGDGGAATGPSVSFSNPSSVAVDSAGNVYVADYFNYRVRKIDSTGKITTLAGTGTQGFSGDGAAAANAELGGPAGVAVDSAGNVYIADSANYRIRKVNVSTGIITTVAGGGASGAPGFSGDGGAATSAQFRAVYGVAVDSGGNIYIADTDNNRVRMVTASNGKVNTIAGNGASGYAGDGGSALNAEVSYPWDIAVDSAGTVYIADTFNNAIRRVANGVITTIAGGGAGFLGGGPTNGIIVNAADGLTVDAGGNVYVADTDDQRIIELSPPAPVITGVSPASASQLGQSITLTVTGSGFFAGATIDWNGAPLTTTFVSGSQLTAVVPANLVSSVGTAAITVVNPSAVVSNVLTFTIGFPSLAITFTTLPAGTVGTAYSQVLSAGGGQLPYHNWIVTSGALPPGLTLDANAGTITGIPTSAVGSPYLFTVTVMDSGGTVSAPITFTVKINPPASVVILNQPTLPGGMVGAAYQLYFYASGGTQPYINWAITSGSLPPGTSLTNFGFCVDPQMGSQAASGCTVWGLLSGTPTTAGAYTFTVRVGDSAAGSALNQFTLNINPAGVPSITAGGVVNAASYAAGGIAPGEVVAIFGAGLGPNALQTYQVSNGKLATSLAGAQVTFDGVAAPLLYAQSSQLSAIVPYEVAGKTSTKVVVSYQNQSSNTLTVPVVNAEPGIFTLTYSGAGPGVIFNQDGTVNTTTNPAHAGSTVYVWATGEGQTSPGGVDGAIDSSPAPTPAQAVTATIGGFNAAVKSAAGIPGAPAGLLQVALTVPVGLGTNAAAAVVLNVGGAASQYGVTLAAAP
ncbi:MAG TPA: putative Ig domain-containing protein [Bryobacteraceae bacterium]|nr:putative Ig domain-containing protein [Bryobacteraceae bacterium]